MKIKLLTETATMPTRGTENSAGLDLYVDTVKPMSIYPGKTKMFSSGIAVEIPDGYWGGVFIRSGISTKRGIVLQNGVGVIDSDYRGEIMLPLYNSGSEPQTISAHERVAQLIVIPYKKEELELAEDLNDTERGNGGFGSTGRK